MEKVTESTTFFKAIDGTKFFSEEECDRYEREHPEEILDAIRKELAQVSYELSYYKEWVLPRAEKNFEESKARFVKRRNEGDWANVSNAYLEFQARSIKKSQVIKIYKKWRTRANDLIRRKNELLATVDKKLYNFDDVFVKNPKFNPDEIAKFKTWAGDKAKTSAEKRYWGRLYTEYLNRKEETFGDLLTTWLKQNH